MSDKLISDLVGAFLADIARIRQACKERVEVAKREREEAERKHDAIEQRLADIEKHAPRIGHEVIRGKARHARLLLEKSLSGFQAPEVVPDLVRAALVSIAAVEELAGE